MVCGAAGSRGWGRARTGLVFVLFGGIAAAVVVVWWLVGDPPETDKFEQLVQTTESVVVDEATVARIKTFCGDCHAVPIPESFPRYAWHTEVRAGYEFYAKSGRTDLDPPPIGQTVAYYRNQAPETLTFPVPAESARKLAVTFDIERLGTEAAASVSPAVSQLKWCKLDHDADPMMVISDMRSGTVMALKLGKTRSPARLLAQLNHPCHVEPCDLDGNGTIDLVVSDLGSFPPGDHQLGRVVWLSRQVDDVSYQPIVIAEGIGRVADARPADFDGDGDLDIIVAVFGMDRTGKIMLLRNVTSRADAGDAVTLDFEMETIDARPGAIHVPPYDFNGDGYLDFAALISQEYEQVAVFINQQGVDRDHGRFHLQTLWEGPDITFGSSGLNLVDLDEDGDADLLYTNGDSFDNGFVNPRHGVQWLENLGSMKFAYHRLTDLTGAYAALAGDLDLDGDRDIIAVAWLPSMVEPGNVLDKPCASVVLLEQVTPGQFERHTLEENVAVHATLEMADFDADGDLDFAVGFHSLGRVDQSPHWVAIWWNQIKQVGDEQK